MKTIGCLVFGAVGGIMAAQGIIDGNIPMFLLGAVIAVVSIIYAFPNDKKED